MLQTFNVDGNGRQVDTAARFCRYESGSAAGADTSIRVRADGNDLGTYLPGDAIRLPLGLPTATRWTFTPASSALVATVRLGMAEVESSRLVGTVNVVDDSRAKTEAGLQFWGVPASVASGAAIRVAACYANTRRVVVKRLAVVSEVAGDVQFFTAQGLPIPASFVDSGPWPNKLAGAAGSDAKIHKFNLASASSVTSGVDYPTASPIATLALTANTLAELPLTTPMVLPAGYSIGVNAMVLSRGIKLLIDGETL